MTVFCVLISEQQALYFEIVVTIYPRLTKKRPKLLLFSTLRTCFILKNYKIIPSILFLSKFIFFQCYCFSFMVVFKFTISCFCWLDRRLCKPLLVIILLSVQSQRKKLFLKENLIPQTAC